MSAAERLIAAPGVAGAGAWTLDPLTTAALAAFAATVVWAAVQRSADRQTWRLVPLAMGLLVALVAVDSWPAVYGRALLSVFVSQQLLLFLVSPLLIAFGRPLDLVTARLPPTQQRILRRLRGLRPGYRAITHPLLGPLLVPAVLAVLVFTALPAMMARNVLLAGAVHLSLLLIGLAVAAPLARDVAYATSLAFGLALAVGLVELLVDAIPGIALRLDGHVLGAVSTLADHRSWGPSAISDQQTAGAILWSVAEILDVPFLLIVLRQWVRADARDAQRFDAALEQADEMDEKPAQDQPWWEIDARVFGESRQRALETNRRRGHGPHDPSGL